MFLDFGVFKKLHFRPFCAQRHSTATQPGASFCARLADFAKSCDRRCMDFFDHLSPYARKSVVRAPPSFFLVFFFFIFTCWPCPSFLLIFNTFSNSFSDFPSYFVYQRRHFWSRPLAGVAGRRISSINVVIFCTKCYSRWGFGILRRDGIIVAGWIHCVSQLIWKKPIAFSQPILRIGFNNIHFGAKSGPGVQNCYFLKRF